VVLTLLDSVAPNCYHCELTVIVSRPLGRHLLSVSFPCRERKPITRLVNFFLTSESAYLKPHSLGEACLKVRLSG
jgi:hypothetical protein